MIRVGVRVTGIGGINEAIGQRQRATLILLLGIESHPAAYTIHSVSCNRGRNHHRTKTSLRAVGDVQRVDCVKVICHPAADHTGERIHIKRPGNRVNDRRAGDAHFRYDVRIGVVVVTGPKIFVREHPRYGRHRRRAEVRLPEQPARRRRGFRIERIDRIVFRGDEQDVVPARPRNHHARHIQRLRIDAAIHRVGEKPAERRRVDVRQGQKRFVGVQARAVVVIVIGPDADLRAGGCEHRRNQPATGDEKKN